MYTAHCTEKGNINDENQKKNENDERYGNEAKT